MKQILTILFSFLILSSADAQSNDKLNIVKVFNDYKSAILNDDAEEALSSIDSKTIMYYNTVLTEVKNADSNKISKMSLIDKITVLGIRSIATRQEILEMQGSDAFLFAIRKGMVGKNSVINNSVGDITIDENFAKGELLVNGEKTPAYFHFYKEGDVWKFNLTELFALATISLNQMVEESGKTENEFLLEILGMLTGKNISNDIWQPIK